MMTTRRLSTFVLFLLMGLAIQATAQRGGRGGDSRRPSARSTQNDLSDLKFEERLWFGAGGTLGFQGGNNFSLLQVGLTPQVGYKITDWLSAGPRFGATFSRRKEPAVRGNTGVREVRGYSTVDFMAGGFTRARYRQFYVQGEFNAISAQTANGRERRFAAVIDDQTNEIITERFGDQQLQIGAGYASQNGGTVGTDIGVFYNLFTDSESLNISPIELRFQLTFRY